MKKNSSLHAARAAKNDEFYTQISDIEKELKHYSQHFKNKTVFLNCDDPEESHFWKYFSLNFEQLGLRRLVSFHFSTEKPTYMLEIIADIDGNGKINDLDTVKKSLQQNGDFRSPESIATLKEADIIATNPPFSLFREFIGLLLDYEKKFLVVGSMNAITYKEVFKHIKENRLWLGITNPKQFRKPNGELQSFGNICWFTNLEHSKRNETLILFQKYDSKKYPKYDNYNAIEVSKVQDIPVDYDGVMGVPVTFLSKYNPEQFEICGTRRWFYDTSLGVTGGKTLINGKETYDRIFIKHKKT